MINNNPVLKAPKIIKTFRAGFGRLCHSGHSRTCMYCKGKFEYGDQVIFKLTDRGEWKTAHVTCPIIEGE